MMVTALGHAGLELDHRGARVQIDPWFSPEGAFQASWFQWPDNSHLVAKVAPPHAVVISHEHLDHVDPWWLARLPRGTPIYVPHYPLDVLRRKIMASGQTAVCEVDPWNEVEVVPGVRLFFATERSPMNHDAAVVLRTEKYALINCNDTRVDGLQLREMRARIGHAPDLLALQGAGASWFPMAYTHLDADAKASLSWRKRMAKLGYIERAVRAVEPVAILPFAGPPCFLDPELRALNAEMGPYGIFPDQGQVAAWMRARGWKGVLPMLPGDQYDLATRTYAADPHWKGFSFDRREAEIAAYAARRRAAIDAVRARYPDPTEDLGPAVRAYFEELFGMSAYFCDKIGMRVGLDATGPGGGTWTIDFCRRRVEDGLGAVAYRYTLASRWLAPILRREVPWEDFFLSCRFAVWRDPDVYNDHLLGLLKFADRRALAAVEAWERGRDDGETIAVRADGRCYEVQRFCPHAGQDLAEVGEVAPGDVLRCLGHHYEYDLRTGICRTGGDLTLRTRLVG
jgi:UDP-MurNAc hydroxylase